MNQNCLMLNALILLVAVVQGVAEPSLRLEAPSIRTLEAGGSLAFTVWIDLGPLPASADVSLLPLDLHNLRKTSVDTAVQQTFTAGGEKTTRWFRITVAPLRPGSASVGEVSVQIVQEEGGEPLVLSTSGFSLSVIEPFDWGPVLPWLAASAVALFAALLITFFALRRRRKRMMRTAGEPGDERLRILDELDRHLRMGDSRKAVDTAFDVILKGLAGQHTATERLTRRQLEQLSHRWPGLPVAYRLGEETRYGGYEADGREAGFIVNLARKILEEG